MKRIIYDNDEGGVSILIPAECGLTIEQIAEKDVPKGKAYKIVDTVTIPSDRHFRNAWKHSEGVIEVDMPKAVEIQKEKLRQERKPLLEALDAEYMRALENEDKPKQKEIKDEKQRLRDITSFNANTVEELKNLSCKKEK